VNITKKEKEWKVFDKESCVAELTDLRIDGPYGFGRLSMRESLEELKKRKILDFLSEELKKDLKESSIQIVFKDFKMDDMEGKDYFLLNRSEMEIDLRSFDFEEKNDEEFFYLNFESLEGLSENIYNDTPKYDRMMLRLDSPEKTRNFYYDLLVSNKYDACLNKLNFCFGNPLKGFIINIGIKSKKDIFLIGDLIVFKKFRRKGIGRNLIEKTLSEAKKLNYSKALLAVTDRNYAKVLYESLGFKTVFSVTSLYLK